MPCYHPIPAQLEISNRPGQPPKRGMKLHPKGQPSHWLPCGTCLGCREVQQQQLAIRLAHEARYHTNNQFLTLTYDDKHYRAGLQKPELQRFWKRLRRAMEIPDMKYLACGEYGDRTRRAHYHAAVLSLPLNDLKQWDLENRRSDTLERIWQNGIITVSELTEDRIKYVAGYVLKKAGYKRQHYADENGKPLQAPYRDMSKGLGKRWVAQFATDLRQGYLQHHGAKYTIPRYYRDIIKETNPQLDSYIAQQQAQNWKEITTQNREELKTAEKIREQSIREHRREQV